MSRHGSGNDPGAFTNYLTQPGPLVSLCQNVCKKTQRRDVWGTCWSSASRFPDSREVSLLPGDDPPWISSPGHGEPVSKKAEILALTGDEERGGSPRPPRISSVILQESLLFAFILAFGATISRPRDRWHPQNERRATAISSLISVSFPTMVGIGTFILSSFGTNTINPSIIVMLVWMSKGNTAIVTDEDRISAGFMNGARINS